MNNFGPSKRMRLRRPDRCACCGRDFVAGDEALWHREAKVVTCVECVPAPADDPDPDVVVVTEAVVTEAAVTEPEVQAGVAGASALREYQKRHRKREERARASLGFVGVALSRIIAEPQSTSAWQRGARGETAVAKRFDKHLAGTEVRLLHDRLAPGRRRANIDHIAIGPSGITVIDTKNYKGKVRVLKVGGLFAPRRTILEIGGRDQTKLVTAVEDQVRLVTGVLDGTEFADVSVVGALCFANVDGLPAFSRQQLRGVTIDGARHVAKLANRPGDLPEGAIARLWDLVGRAMPPA